MLVRMLLTDVIVTLLDRRNYVKKIQVLNIVRSPLRRSVWSEYDSQNSDKSAGRRRNCPLRVVHFMLVPHMGKIYIPVGLPI